MALPGVSTLGILFGYGVETTAGTKPTSFTQLTRINSIGGISLETNTIDASALEDDVTKSVAGRSDTGGSFPVTFNLTDDTLGEWQKVISDYNALTGGKQMWFTVWSPSLAKAFFVIAQPPQALPMPDSNQNELFTCEVNLTIVDYKGMDAAVKPVPKVA